jgi:7-cyano-7-deazaguanine synthase
MKQAVLSLSGGMDSSTLLLHLLANDYKVTALSFDYGQKHRVELERAQQLVDYLNNNGQDVTYQTIKLDGLTSLLDSALVEGGDDVPEGHYEEDNMNKTESAVKIAMGIHAGDHAIYPDCRQEFRDADYKAFAEGNWEASRVSSYTPYLNGDKFDILKDGEVCCKELGIDFDEVYKRTNTSYKPTAEGLSDYKSASSVERIEAFLKLGRKDPVIYVDGWDTAKSHVEKLLAEHANKPNMNDTIDMVNNM